MSVIVPHVAAAGDSADVKRAHHRSRKEDLRSSSFVMNNPDPVAHRVDDLLCDVVLGLKGGCNELMPLRRRTLDAEGHLIAGQSRRALDDERGPLLEEQLGKIARL